MKRLTFRSSAAAAAVVVAAATATAPAHASVTVLDEGFGNLALLTDWDRINRSDPPGTGWFQGNAGIFAAQSGPANSYAGANFLGAANGAGLVDNWLITPTLELSGLTTLSFFTNRDAEAGFANLLEVRYGSGSGTDAASFGTLLTSIGGAGAFPSDWTQWNTNLTVLRP